MTGEGENWLECCGDDAVPLERMLLRIEQRPGEHCQQAFKSFGNISLQSRQILDIAAAWVLRDQHMSTRDIWSAMNRAAKQPTSVSDAANELLLLAIEWLVRNRGRFENETRGR